MDLSDWIWLATAAYSIHIVEEFMFDWRNWARHVIGFPVEWSDFYIVNAVVIALGICAANLASAAPAIALGYPALVLINGIFFHILPVIKTKGRFSPGVITAVILFLPVGIGTFWAASSAGILDARTLAISVLIGALLMASPIVFLKLRSKPYFLQDHA